MAGSPLSTGASIDHMMFAGTARFPPSDRFRSGRLRATDDRPCPEMSMPDSRVIVTPALADALALAIAGHAGQVRKDTTIRYVAKLATLDPDIALVIAADKLHNASCIVADVEARGPDEFDRFAEGREGVSWYFGQRAESLGSLIPPRLGSNLTRAVDRLRTLSAA